MDSYPLLFSHVLPTLSGATNLSKATVIGDMEGDMRWYHPATRRKNSSQPESVEISPTQSSMMTVRTVEARKPKVPRT